MKHPSLLPLLAVWLGTPLALTAENARHSPTADVEFFERKVRPVLVEKCGKCHNAGKTRGGLNLASREALLKGGDNGPAVVPGQPDKSLLLKAVRYTRGDLQMPPAGKLPDNVIEDLATWIKRGASWPAAPAAGETAIRPPGSPITARDRAFWSFRPIANPPLPEVKNTAWPRRPLDRFILAELERRHLRPVAGADRRALLRRVTFDLIGLPPTPEEVESFVADRSPDAWAKVVDRLLASPAYGERWGRHWLDVARYGEDQAHTFQARLYPHGWRYRDWVVKSFNDDLPYDQFVLAQIAGDLMVERRNPEQLAALGFFGLGPVYYADAGEKKAAEAAELDDRIDTLCRGFLGLTVACARCHDHKFDPISNQDYYSLAGIIRSSEYKLAFIATPEEAQRYQQAQDRIKAQDGRIKSFLDGQSVRLAEGKSGEVAHYLVAAWKLQTRRNKNPRLNAAAVAREEKLDPASLEQWSRYLFRRGSDKRPHLAVWRQALAGLDGARDLSRDAAAIAAVTKSAAAFQADVQTALRERDTLAAVGKPLVKEKADLLREIFSPPGLFRLDPRQVEKNLGMDARKTLTEMRAESARLRKASPTPPPMAHSITEGKPADMRIYLRGNPHKEGDVAPRHFLRILAGDSPPLFNKGSGRRQLAQAIASPDNPLTARVMVNRIWQHHFGKGIVGTPSNFGLLGERPTHPELLDHLASKFIASNWSIKAVHREILLSSTYQLGCIHDPSNAAVDAGNRWYWRMDRQRLDVESWRDGLLAATGALDRTLGGPPSDLNNSNNRRRTLYGAVSRHHLSGLLRLFDFPDANLTSEKRPVTIVPLQQLFVLNSDFMVERARSLAQMLQKEAKDDPARIRLASSRLYGRPARDWEVAVGMEFLTAPDNPATGAKASLSRWEQYAQVLLGANEFTFLD
jgi:cytochrome c553